MLDDCLTSYKLLSYTENSNILTSQANIISLGQVYYNRGKTAFKMDSKILVLIIGEK